MQRVSIAEKAQLDNNNEGAVFRLAIVEFAHEQSVPYALRVMNNVHLFGEKLNVRPRVASIQDSGMFVAGFIILSNFIQ